MAPQKSLAEKAGYPAKIKKGPGVSAEPFFLSELSPDLDVSFAAFSESSGFA